MYLNDITSRIDHSRIQMYTDGTNLYIHTYIIGHYFTQDCDLTSHTTYVVCVNFIHEDLELRIVSKQQIFWETSHGNFICSQKSARNLLRGSRRRKICSYCYENGNDVIKMTKHKTIDVFTWSTNKHKYSNNISIKKGINKQQ